MYDTCGVRSIDVKEISNSVFVTEKESEIIGENYNTGNWRVTISEFNIIGERREKGQDESQSEMVDWRRNDSNIIVDSYVPSTAKQRCICGR